MQLCYRGIPYRANSIALPTIETETQGRFLSQSYKLRHVAVNLEIPDKKGMIYRGVCSISDSKPKTGRFLGNIYSRSHVSIAVI